MCLAIPGKIIEISAENPESALVDVVGVRRKSGLGLLQDDRPVPGDWVLIHVGFAMSKISEEDALDQMRTLACWGRRGGDAGSSGLRLGRDELDCRRAMKPVASVQGRSHEIRGRVSRARIDHHELRRDPPPGRSRAALSADGSVRRPHPRHLSLRPERSASRQYRTDPRTGLPGLRACPWAESTTACRSRSSPT